MTMEYAQAGYFDLDYYKRIYGIVKSWTQWDAVLPSDQPDPETAAECQAIIFNEARLIDRGRLEEWLDLFTDHAAYWIPADTNQLDPAKTVSWEFNDRRRMEERVERILTGKAYSDIPATKLTHCYTNIEQKLVAEDEIHIQCSFMINAIRPEGRRLLSGWNGFILKQISGEWLIDLKRVNLADADAPQGNLSFFL